MVKSKNAFSMTNTQSFKFKLVEVSAECQHASINIKLNNSYIILQGYALDFFTDRCSAFGIHATFVLLCVSRLLLV